MYIRLRYRKQHAKVCMCSNEIVWADVFWTYSICDYCMLLGGTKQPYTL